MSVSPIAKKDFQDAIRSRWLLGLTALFVGLVSLSAYIVRPAPGQTVSSNSILQIINQVFVGILVPLIALVISYNAITGERESGSLKLLLALPHSRADLVVGKVIGRVGALTVPLLVGFILPAVVLAVGPLEFQAVTYLGYVLAVCLLGAVYVAIAVGLSAAVATQRLAITGAILLYFLFVPLWDAVQFPLQIWLSGGTPVWLPLTLEELLRLLELINPNGAFGFIADGILTGGLYQGQGARLEISATLMLVTWLIALPLLGVVSFENQDL